MPILLIIMVVFLGACRGSRPADLGAKDGVLRPCPNRPNCVSSQAPIGSSQRVEPLKFRQGVAAEIEFTRLKKIVSEQPRAKLITDGQEYVHAEFSSRLLGFVDDVEVVLNRVDHCAEVRSASRLGYSDMNVNRNRIETLRKLFNGDS